MFQYTIAHHVFSNLNISVEPAVDAPSLAQIKLKLASQKVGNDDARDAFIHYLTASYDVDQVRDADGNQILNSQPKAETWRANDASYLGDFLQHLAAYYNVPVQSILTRVQPEELGVELGKALGNHRTELGGKLSFIDDPTTNNIQIMIQACPTQTRFCAWLERFYNVNRVEQDGVIISTLEKIKGTHDGLNHAEHLVQLVRAIHASWGIDLKEVIQCVEPAVSRQYCENRLGLFAAAPVQSEDLPYGLDVVTVGAGFSGITTIYQTLKKLINDPPPLPVRFQLLERNPAYFAAGLAYGAAGPEHHVNVQAKFISIDPNNPNDFVDWIKHAIRSGHLGDAQILDIPDNIEIPSDSPETAAVQRRLYHYYMLDRLFGIVTEAQAAGVADVDIHFAEAVAGDVSEDEVCISLKDGQTLEGTDLVLANGHGPVTVPAFLEPVRNDDRVVVSQWETPGKADKIFRNEDVRTAVVLGSGLSGMDEVVTAESNGFFSRDRKNKLMLISRGGHTHAVMAEGGDYAEPKVDLDSMVLPTSVDEVVPFVQKIVATLTESGTATIGREHTSEEVFSALRQQIPAFLKKTELDIGGLFALAGKYSSMLTTAAVSMAPVIGHAFEHFVNNGQIIIVSADPQSIVDEDGRLTINLKQRGKTVQIVADAVLSALPPASTPEKIPLLKNLLDKGTVRKHPATGIGLDVAPETYQVINKQGAPLPNAYLIGPVIGGEEMVNHGLIGPLYQIITGLRIQGSVISNQLFEKAHKAVTPVAHPEARQTASVPCFRELVTATL